jgi:dienelactone hydrolase
MIHQNSAPLWSPTVSPDTEPMQIAIARGEWIDVNRNNRKIAYKTYCPMNDAHAPYAAPYPVILWSHGLGGSRDGAGFISRFVASHGYIVVHIQHAGTDSTLWEGKPGHPWDVIRATPIPRSATLNRFKDVPFALSQLPTLDIAPLMDLSRIGMSGHSFGAMTTQVMAGQKRGYGARQYSLHDPRFKCGIVYSPVPVKDKKHHAPEDFYGGIKIPLLIMTGTDDDSPIEHYTYHNRLEVFTHSGGPEQHLLVLDKGDHMVFSGSRGKLDANPKRDIHEDIIKILSLAFWDAYLKGDKGAKDWLTSDNVSHWLSSEGDYRYTP